MDDKLADAGGIPRVDATALDRDDAEEFKDQVQGALLRRMHEKRAVFALKRVELRAHPMLPATVGARLFGFADRGDSCVGEVTGSTPRQLADALYRHLGGTNPPTDEEQ